jgi:hypothetical protein
MKTLLNRVNFAVAAEEEKVMVEHMCVMSKACKK